MNTIPAMLQFAPRFKEKIWGGSRLLQTLGKQSPFPSTTGESWELSGLTGDESQCISTGYEGRTLPEMVTSFPEMFHGGTTKIPHATFPLLFKFIDAQEMLSIQVHPATGSVDNKGVPIDKTECWYIVHAEANAEIILGLTKECSKKEVEQHLATDTVESLLMHHPVKTGDLFFVPSGAIHAIGKGCLIYEVQQSSDTTYRFYDWNRIDKDGNRRPLHTHEALASLDTTFVPHQAIIPVKLPSRSGIARTLRCACRYFAIEEWVCEQEDLSLEIPARSSFQVLTLLEGSLTPAECDRGKNIRTGETILIPAAKDSFRCRSCARTRFLLTREPDLEKEIIAPLLAAATPHHTIIQLAGAGSHNDILQQIYKR